MPSPPSPPPPALGRRVATWPRASTPASTPSPSPHGSCAAIRLCCNSFPCARVKSKLPDVASRAQWSGLPTPWPDLIFATFGHMGHFPLPDPPIPPCPRALALLPGKPFPSGLSIVTPAASLKGLPDHALGRPLPPFCPFAQFSSTQIISPNHSPDCGLILWLWPGSKPA